MKITKSIMKELGFTLKGYTYYKNDTPNDRPRYNTAEIMTMSLGDLIKDLLKHERIKIQSETMKNVRRAIGLTI